MKEIIEIIDHLEEEVNNLRFLNDDDSSLFEAKRQLANAQKVKSKMEEAASVFNEIIEME